MNDQQRIQQNIEKPNTGQAGCSLIINGIAAVIFFIYGWYNPDDVQCYAFNDSSRVSTKNLSGSIDVTHIFKLWFKLGFLIKISGVLYGLLAFVSISRGRPGKITQCFGCLQTLFWVFLVGWGSLIRWRLSGQACSGKYYSGVTYKPDPYLWDSGQTIKIYLILCYLIIGLCLCIGCCLCCVLVGSIGGTQLQRESRSQPKQRTQQHPYYSQNFTDQTD